MPSIHVTLPETGQSITRPVIFDVIRKVQSNMGISENTKIFFAGDSKKMSTPGATISNNNKAAIFSSDRYMFIEVEEDYTKDQIAYNPLNANEHMPILADVSIGLILLPIYSNNDIIINFKYSTPSKTEALRWRDEMRVKISPVSDTIVHTVNYHYTLPPLLLEIITAAYLNREQVAGYGDTLQHYIEQYSTKRLGLVGDLVNKNRALIVKESQTRILGRFTFDGLPDKVERDDETGNWISQFTHSFSYEKPLACGLRYPVMVHNQLMPDWCTNIQKVKSNIPTDPNRFSTSIGALNAFEPATEITTRLDLDAAIRIPTYDDYVLKTFPMGTSTVFTALSEVESDLKTLINLKELGDIVIDDDILEFIEAGEYQYLNKLYNSTLNVTIYRNHALMSPDLVVCNSNLDISSSTNLDLRNQHRVRFSVLTDLGLIKKPALLRLKNYPKAFVKILGAMNDGLRNNPDFNDLGHRTVIREKDINNIYTRLVGFDLNGLRNQWAVVNDIPYTGPYNNNITNTIRHARAVGLEEKMHLVVAGIVRSKYIQYGNDTLIK